MKVKEIIKIIENDGWYLSKKEVTDNSNILLKVGCYNCGTQII
ncbi:MAG: hypothetical protein R2764_19495 [Bacteroidales bacterium]